VIVLITSLFLFFLVLNYPRVKSNIFVAETGVPLARFNSFKTISKDWKIELVREVPIPYQGKIFPQTLSLPPEKAASP
jgi:hypothetical protein